MNKHKLKIVVYLALFIVYIAISIEANKPTVINTPGFDKPDLNKIAVGYNFKTNSYRYLNPSDTVYKSRPSISSNTVESIECGDIEDLLDYHGY